MRLGDRQRADRVVREIRFTNPASWKMLVGVSPLATAACV
jgi:hypothetical protein